MPPWPGLHRPDLREVPVAVCGDPARRHGIVLAKNMPAKRYGIQTGQVLWQAFQLCPRLTTIAPDYREVSRMSQTVRTILGVTPTGCSHSASTRPGWI